MRRRLSDLPAPKAVDPRSGFVVPHSELVREYRGDLIARRFADKPHPRDFPVRIRENIALPNARPEPPELRMATSIVWEDGYSPIIGEDGSALLSEGEVVVL